MGFKAENLSDNEHITSRMSTPSEVTLMNVLNIATTLR